MTIKKNYASADTGEPSLETNEVQSYAEEARFFDELGRELNNYFSSINFVARSRALSHDCFRSLEKLVTEDVGPRRSERVDIRVTWNCCSGWL